MCYLSRTPATSRMLLVDKIVLFGNFVSCSSLTLITSIADPTGMEVKSDVTSNEVIHSSSSNLVFLISSANSLLLLHGRWTYQLGVLKFLTALLQPHM